MKSVFDNSKDLYTNALSSSGFKDKIRFNPVSNKKISRNKNRKKKIIWFNPPYNSNVFTNIGKRFLTNFNKLHKIFNRNNVKISYSSWPNFASIINSHNKKIINNNILKPSAPTCNCCSKTSCPLNEDCLQSSLVYICKADTPNIIENDPHYIGLTENTFKDPFKDPFSGTKTHSNMKVNKMQQNYQILYGKISMPTLKRILSGKY